jgi:hypothetical protein
MKKQIAVVILICISLLGYSQSKTNVQALKIKSTTIVSEDYEDSKGKTLNESYTRFDALGNEIEMIDYDKAGKIKTHVYNDYDKEGNKIRETYLKPNGTKDKVIENKFENGQKTGETHYKGNGAIDKTVEYVYKNGLKSEKRIYNAAGKVKSVKKYIYEF